jgi:hypothetical protein
MLKCSDDIWQVFRLGNVVVLKDEITIGKRIASLSQKSDKGIQRISFGLIDRGPRVG